MDYLGEEPYNSPPTQQPLHPQHHLDQPLTLTAGPDPQTPSNPSVEHSNLPPYTPDPTLTDAANPSDPYNGMPPPPQHTYPDLQSLMTACQAHGRAHGYACVTSSNNYKRGIAYVRCDRGGEYVNHWNVTPETRVRKNRTRRLVGCKWKARAKRVGDGGEWQLTMMEDKHTGHGPSGDLSQHPSLRQLPEEAVEAAKRAFDEGRSPKDVLEVLRVWNPVVTAQDVYNLKAKINRKDGGGNGGGTGEKGTLSNRTGKKRSVAAKATGDAAGEGDGTVDPALRAQDAFGHLTAAVAQMQDTAQGALALPNGQPSSRKCACTCCEH